jgi:hypothetical protein
LSEIPVFALLSPSWQVSAPAEDDVSQITFLQAAAAKSPTIAFPTASMPTVNFNLVDTSGNVLEAETRKAFLDTGCNVNLVSKRAFQANSKSFGPDVKVYNIKPFNVYLADGKSETTTYQVVLNACITIGKAFYPLSFLVVENCTVDFLIGFPFFFMYDLQLKAASSTLSLGIPKKNIIPEKRHSGPYQTVDVKFHTRKLTLTTV